jgi:uncharacterized membrane protein
MRRLGAVAKTERNTSVDLLRGVVMVIMALDHTRDYFSGFTDDPTNLAITTVPLFLTRFVTHYCAPVFVFLAGTGAYLSAAGGRPIKEVSRFLWTRGLWLAVLEVTIVRFCWVFNVDYRFSMLQVIWAIGVSMIALAALVHLPLRAIVAIGAVLVLGHNLLDRVHATTFGAWHAAWSIVHEPDWDWEPLAGHRMAIAYPLVPWIGVMALGYACGAWIVRPKEERKRILIRAGLVLLAVFLVLRATNEYGDPHPWSVQKSTAFTLLSFLNVEKYPPSLLYLCVTLGPALVFLGLLDSARGPFARVMMTYGRVPLFYYVLHILVINTTALTLYFVRHGRPPPPDATGYAHGLALPAVYGIWLAIVVALYPACVWYSRVKARKHSVLLSYL